MAYDGWTILELKSAWKKNIVEEHQQHPYKVKEFNWLFIMFLCLKSGSKWKINLKYYKVRSSTTSAKDLDSFIWHKLHGLININQGFISLPTLICSAYL